MRDAQHRVEVRHHDGREDRDGADRQVHARGQDDDRLPDGERPDDRDLPDDEGQVGRLQEPIGDDEAERRHDHDQDDERPQRRVLVERVLDALQR
jgi:hypothetical protein